MEAIVRRSELPIRRIAILAVLAVLATACGGGADDAEPDSNDGATTSLQTGSSQAGSSQVVDESEPGEESATLALFDSYEGVTAETIKIGVVWSNLDELRELGLVDINYGDVPLVWQTLVDDINANGGVGGRQLEMVFDQYNPVLTASVEEMCTRLTQDEKVFAVVGSLAGPVLESILCFLDINETIMVAGTHRPDLLERAKAPWITTGMSQDRRYRALVELYDQEDLLVGKLATLDNSQEHEGLTNRILVPVLERLGKEVTTQLTSTVAEGDEVALAQQVGVFAERLDQDEIDTLLIVQNQIALGLPLIREAGFEGTILTIDSGSYLTGLGGFDERDPAVYEGAYGPTLFTAEASWAMKETQDCVRRFTDANPEIDVIPAEQVPDGEPSWASVLIPACRFLDVFTRVAEQAGADLNPDSFLAAAAGIGPFALAGQPFNSLSAGKLDADDGMGLGIFDPSVGEEGGLVEVTPYISVTTD